MYTKQPVGVDILLQQLRGRVVVPPLGGVAVFRHEIPRTGIDLKDLCHIRSYRSAKHIFSSSLARALPRGVHFIQYNTIFHKAPDFSPFCGKDRPPCAGRQHGGRGQQNKGWFMR